MALPASIDGWVDAGRRFLRSPEAPYPALRRGAAALAFLLAVVAPFAATGQGAGGHPVEAIALPDMMHCENGSVLRGADCRSDSYGRLGTLDPGDLVLVVGVDDPDEVATAANGKGDRHGGPGDVLVFSPGPGRLPVAHRALFFLAVNPDGTYSVPALGIEGATTLDQPQLTALTNCTLPARTGDGQPLPAGFITKGDNNGVADQCTVAGQPVAMSRVYGRAQREIPWLGLPGLLLRDLAVGTDDFEHAPPDSKAALAWTLVLTGAAARVAAFATRPRKVAQKRRQSPKQGMD